MSVDEGVEDTADVLATAGRLPSHCSCTHLTTGQSSANSGPWAGGIFPTPHPCLWRSVGTPLRQGPHVARPGITDGRLAGLVDITKTAVTAAITADPPRVLASPCSTPTSRDRTCQFRPGETVAGTLQRQWRPTSLLVQSIPVHSLRGRFRGALGCQVGRVAS